MALAASCISVSRSTACFRNRLFTSGWRRPYPWLVACAERFADTLSSRLGERLQPHDVLFDAPPVKREVEFQVDIYFAKEGCYRPFGEVSPVVRTLALEQFDDYVKRVRIFVHPRISAACRAISDLPRLLHQTIDAL